MEKRQKSSLDKNEEDILEEKYKSEGMSEHAGKKRLEFVIKNMVVPDV